VAWRVASQALSLNRDAAWLYPLAGSWQGRAVPETPPDFDGASMPVLLDALHSDNPGLRSDAACAIGDRLRARELDALEPAVQQRLVQLLADGVLLVRFEAAMALAEAHDRRATPVLLDATAIRTLRLDATRALGTLGDRGAVPRLKTMLGRWLFPWADRLQAAAALCALGEPAGQAYLVSKLQSRRRAERAAAIHFLGESRHPEGCRLLSRILQDARDPMRDVAARALGHLRDPKARDALGAALTSAQGELAQDIRDALAKLPNGDGTAAYER
jgi:HEAT repeat protein